MLAEGMSRLCADEKLKEKYADTCSQSELLDRCNKRDVLGAALMMRMIHDPAVTKEDCNRLLSLIGEQEECRAIAQTYVPAWEDLGEIKTFCGSL